MIRVTLRLVAVLLFAGALYGVGMLGARAASDNAPVLRSNVTVSGSYVTLGDLFDNAGAAASIPVFRSPDLGQTGTVSAYRVEDAARAHGLAWQAAGAPQDVSVTRASTLVPLDDITAVIEGAIRDKTGIAADNELTVTLDSSAAPLHLPATADGMISAKRVDIYNNGSFHAEIDAGTGSSYYFRGQAVETISLPILTRDVTRGEVLGEGDIELRRVPRGRVITRDVLTEPADIVAKAAKRALRAGTSLRASDVEEPKLVRRGELITIEYQTPGLLLSVRGRALGDGAMKEEISVINIQSNRVIQAAVTAIGRVSVIPAGAAVPTRTAAVTAP